MSTRSAERPRRIPRPRRLSVLRALPGILLLLLLAGGFALSLPQLEPARVAAKGRLLGGEWAAGWQRGYERGLLLRPFAIRFWGLLRYALFGEGQPGVLVGSGGWLFTAEEFAFHGGRDRRGEDPALEQAVGAVRAVRDRLRAQGVGLIVAVVPAKARLYPDRLGRYRLPPYAEARYERFRRGLLSSGIQAPDLAAALREARLRGEEVFLRTDTHWSPEGARAAAAALAAAGRRELDRGGVPPAVYRTVRVETRSHRGDLLRYLPLGPLQESLGPLPDTVAVYGTREENPQRIGLFDEVWIPVALVGTSYSSGELWNFEGSLKERLQADVLNVAEPGRGPFAPMRAYLESDAFRRHPPALVIWEIPERYAAAYREDGPAAGGGGRGGLEGPGRAGGLEAASP